MILRKKKMPAYSRDDIVLGIIAEARQEGCDDLAAVCAIACGLVESELTMLANAGDPQTLNYPHDGLSADKNSAGVFQQRYPWWDDPTTDDFGGSSDRMDVARSARMFFKSLLAQHDPDYHTNPGEAIANVQRPREDLRWKYGARLDEAWGIFNHLKEAATIPDNTPIFNEINVIGERPIGYNSQDRDGTRIDLLIAHTTEGAGGQNLIGYMENAGVSYHYLIDNDPDGNTVYDLVDTDLASWSVLDANNRSINYVIGRSFASWTRDEWITHARNAIRIMAYLMVADAHKYDVEPRVVTPPYKHAPPAITDHRYVTVHLGIGTHTDCGNGFPWDLLQSDINEFLGITSGEADPLSGVNIDRLNAAVDKILATPSSRSMFADDDTPIDDMARNTDANVWNLMVIIGALIGLAEDVARVKRAAAGQLASQIAANEWLAARTVAFAKALEPLCGVLAGTIDGGEL